MRKTSTAMDLGQEEANPWRESLEQRLRERMRELIEQVLEEEVEEALGAPRSQRAATRSGYRHGVKPRRLVLRGGAVQVAVPRARSVTPAGGEREWQSRLVPRYRRATPEVEQAVLGVYLSGGNTRRIRAALSPLLRHAPLSKSAVSRLEDLAARKLGRPRLVISDGNPGLAAALERVWPGVPRQRCTVHKLRNLEAKAPQHAHAELREDYHRIVYAQDRAAATRAHQAFLGKWRKRSPAVATSLEEAGEELLTFYAFRPSQWLSLRTTNAIERLQLEFRRRVKTQGALPGETAALRLLFGLLASGQIRLRRIKGFREINEKHEAAA